MITASIVLYKTKEEELNRVIRCSLDSIIDIVYVVDNSPTDSLRQCVTSFKSDRISYIYGQGNVGFGSGNNIAIKEAISNGSKYHIILNPDIIFNNDSITILQDFLDSHSDIGLIAPRLEYPDGRFQAAAMLLPSPFVTFGRRLLPQKYVDRINREFELADYDLTVPREVPNVCGCFMIVRLSVLRLSGLFDERFFMYFEDFDFVRRVHQYSRVVYCPKTTVIHAHGNEHRKSKFLLKAGIKSGIQYFNKWGWLFDLERRKVNRFAKSDSSIIIDN